MPVHTLIVDMAVRYGFQVPLPWRRCAGSALPRSPTSR